MSIAQKPLAIAAINVPTQLSGQVEIDLHADVWFPPAEIRVESEKVVFAFSKARLILGEEDGFVYFGHDQRVQGRINRKQFEDISKGRGLGLKGRLRLNGLLGDASAEGHLGSERKSTESSAREQEFEIHTLESISNREWLLHGYGHPDWILRGLVLHTGEKPLVRIRASSGSVAREIEIEIEIRISLDDLVPILAEGQRKPNQTERQAVIDAIVKRRIRERRKARGSDEDDNLLVARAACKAKLGEA